MPELVKEHRPRLLDAGLDVDHPRLSGVHAAGHAREPGAARQLQRDLPGDRRHERLRRPALPLAGKWPTIRADEPDRALRRERRRRGGTTDRQAEKRAQACEHDDRPESP
jgi:hypothetical protein